MRTLLLDQTYFPVKIVGWQRAMILLLTQRAEVVEEYTDIKIRSISRSFNLPKVLRLHGKFKRVKRVKFCRNNVFLRDNYICQWCHQNFERNLLTLDHVVPRSRGGNSSWENVVTCCHSCNNRKGDKLPSEFSSKILIEPKQPDWGPQFHLKVYHDDQHESFSDWL